MGRKYLDAVYLKLGITEIDDMADAVKALWSRPYIDKDRVGIFGTSYGGYTSVMEILRHPDVFAAASSSSPPTDWRNYDTIYTERFALSPDTRLRLETMGYTFTEQNNWGAAASIIVGPRSEAPSTPGSLPSDAAASGQMHSG